MREPERVRFRVAAVNGGGAALAPMRTPSAAARRRRFVARLIAIAVALPLLAGCAGAPVSPAAQRIADAQSVCAAATLPASSLFAATPLPTGLPTGGQWRDGFDLADMDGDGNVDLLHGPPRKGRALPVIYRGDGHGRFAPWREAHFPPLPYDYGDVRATDFNGDGRMDFVLTSHLRGMVVLINEAGGHYAPWGEGLRLREPGPDGADFTSRSLALADWDGDGHTDILALNEGPAQFVQMPSTEAVALYLHRGGYWERAAVPNAVRGFGDDLAVGDVDGNGHPDALLGSQVGGARLVLQMGSGTTMRSRELRSLPLDAAVTAVALHDFDGDGRDDAVTATRAVEDGRFCSLLQHVAFDADGNETPLALWSERSRTPVVALASADIDGDGRADLVAARQNGEILLFAGRADGFSRDLVLPVPEAMRGCDIFDLALADLDGDGQQDLLASYAGDTPGARRSGCTLGGGFMAWTLGGR
ncbi:FG-GAP repeat domain-containing protein [Chiayiivirga flava]|uniref:VCBS repeat-containing protein n=1 Tax=Chiayiivirga flava TaxID=659595 RepID=A0A7W8FZT1_9GAMM|nr:VCBS repeat-containing protein [Chiayiivirga flava]MBB5208446.1 hypothetical protein [Chiayiivirga flava]